MFSDRTNKTDSTEINFNEIDESPTGLKTKKIVKKSFSKVFQKCAAKNLPRPRVTNAFSGRTDVASASPRGAEQYSPDWWKSYKTFFHM